MSVYVMSDLHGAYNSLLEMLKVIRFSPDDTLYILGDVVDRGADGISILQYAMETPNIKMLLGNHEYMLMQYFKPDATEKTRRQWNRNGNFTTLKGLDAVGEQKKQEIIGFVESLPDEVRIKVGDRKYILVHGFLGEDTYRRVWNRPKIDESPELSENETVVIGHTPVCEYVCPGTDEEMYVYSSRLTASGDYFRILHTKSFINVDCCVGYGMSAARLACIRLDDGAEFYVKVDK